MATPNEKKINQLRNALPEGLIVDAAWLSKNGYATSLVSKYVAAGHLERPAPRVYRKPRGELSWEQVVISLQTLLSRALAVGGRTALELQGFGHYLPQTRQEVHLYGLSAPPGWLAKLPLKIRFVFHSSSKLFRPEAGTPPTLTLDRENSQAEKDALRNGFAIQSWGQWRWPLTLSSPERALVELLDELPDHETFEQVDKLFEGLATLSPRRLQRLLEACKSVKAKRLFFFFADRHPHAWTSQINKSQIDLGHGKRMLVKGGTLNRPYQITVPKDLDAV
ncbi:MAG: type IV toxin-antitoxin system AbiEi family antitoxin [Xanthobacteraceae bacterium]|nr:type IV toxin-antitoxin system AbiEi family antitoxin [Xanthobacteraceae bacterium]